MTLNPSNVSNLVTNESISAHLSDSDACLKSAHWILEQLPFAIARFDKHLNCIDINQPWQALMQFSWSILPGQILPLNQLPQSWQATIQQGLQGVKNITSPHLIKIAQDYCLIQCQVIPWHQQPGTTEGIMLIAEVLENIDSQSKAHPSAEQLHQLQRQFETILQHVPGLIHFKDLDGHFLEVSGRARTGCGEDAPEEAVGKTSDQLFPEDVATAFRKLDQQVIQTQLSCTLENVVPHPDGSPHVYRTVKFPLMHEDGTLYAIGGISSDITAEVALAESEAKYRQLVEQLDEIIFATTIEGVITYISPRCHAITGYQPEELMGGSYKQFAHPEDLLRLQTEMEHKLRYGEDMRVFELRTKIREGGWRWIRCNTSETKDSQGNIIGFQGIATDIHERKIAEAKHQEVETALRQSRQLLQHLAENAPGMLFQAKTTLDGEWNLTYVSPGSRELYGIEAEQILRNPKLMLDIVHPEEKAALYETIVHVVETQQVWQWQGRVTLPSGQIKWIQSFAKAEHQSNSETLWHGFTFDISKQKFAQYERECAEEALRISDARLRTVINTAPAILYAFDQNGIFTFSEGKGLEVLGLNPGEVVGKSIFDVYCDHPEIIEKTKRVIAGEINSYITSVGGRYYETFFNPMLNDDGQVTEIIAAAVDVTEQKQAEAELQKALITEERNRMAREIHDTLAQALTGIFIQLGAASRLLSQDPEAAQHHIEHARVVARSGVAEARRSVEALRSQLLEQGDLSKALSQLVQQLSSLTDANVSFSVFNEPYHLPADIENNLLRIVQEAMTNTIRHALSSEIVVQLNYLPEACVLQVKDDGQGFEMEAEQFQKGYGLLGMQERSVCIGADFQVQSEIGKGTSITVHVPRHPLPMEVQE